jgi:hypothetical protein
MLYYKAVPYSAKVSGANFRTPLEPALDAKVKPPRGGLYLALHGSSQSSFSARSCLAITVEGVGVSRHCLQP